MRALAILGFPDAYTAADHVMPIRALGPLTIEGMDAGLIAALRAHQPNEAASRMLPAGGGWLYVETGGATRAEAEAAARGGRQGGAGGDVAGRRRPGGAAGAVADPGGRGGHRHPQPGRRRGVAGLGGRRRAARAVRRLPAGVRRAAAQARPPRRLLRPLRRRLPAHPDRLRPAHEAGRRRLPLVHGGRGGSGRRARGVALGRARRRGGPRRAAAPHVPAGDHRRVRGVQGHLGPGRPDEPRPCRAAREAGRGPAGVRRAAQPGGTAGAGVHRRPRLVRPGQPPVPGRGAVRHGVAAA